MLLVTMIKLQYLHISPIGLEHLQLILDFFSIFPPFLRNSLIKRILGIVDFVRFVLMIELIIDMMIDGQFGFVLMVNIG